MGIVKEYSNGEVTVIWQPELCIHSGNCVRMLPQVYNTKERPWIKPENGTKEELINQIDCCPSGALSYRLNDKSK
ncbi:MAG: (4Fe-4S)-binding protein [Dysgonomonas sp.]|nr:(4Fe-4S)-binding protein [Dysgonomonas sp.]